MGSKLSPHAELVERRRASAQAVAADRIRQLIDCHPDTDFSRGVTIFPVAMNTTNAYIGEIITDYASAATAPDMEAHNG